ncbi:unnamed protein product [Symbiodinium sp. CCMP2456]|nr:unnamed protein product [Symbiodinium sp. CCMP2456]
MPMRVLGVRKAAVLAEEPEAEWMVLRMEARNVAVLPVLRRPGGLLLAAAGHAFTAVEIEAKKLEGVTEDLGLVGQVEVQGTLADGSMAETPLLLFDWPAALYKFLRVVTGDSWPPNLVRPRHGESTDLTLDMNSLTETARNWVEDGEMSVSEAYLTVLEAPPQLDPVHGPRPQEAGLSADLVSQLLDRMEQTAAAVAGIKDDLENVKQAASSSQQLPKATGPALARADIEDAEEDTGEMGTDELMRLALVNLLSKETKGKKKSARLGLPLAQSSESEEEDPLRRLSGAKGTMLVERLRVAMEADPAAYANAIENLAAQVLGEATPNPMTLERYVREELPMGNERSLGFAAWIMVRAVTRMKAGQWEKGRLVLTLGLAAVEQYRLDGNWTTAWRLTQLSQPPFSEWRSREPYMSQLRVDHAHSRLVHPTWAAAVIARLKDEEVLVKRRRRPDGGLRGPLSEEQAVMIAGTRERMCSMCRLIGDISVECGTKIQGVNEELSGLECEVESLAELVYGGARVNGPVQGSAASSQVVPAIASQVAFPDKLRGFDPGPYLNTAFRQAFECPNSLLMEQGAGSEPMPITSSHTELWHLMWRWDKEGRLCLALEEECDPRHVCNLFCLQKPDGELRQIIDRRPRNAAERGPPADAPKMGHPSSFLGLVVPVEGCLRGCMDDLRNFYHEFSVPLERALSAAVGPLWRARDFQGSEALRELQRRSNLVHPALWAVISRLQLLLRGLTPGELNSRGIEPYSPLIELGLRLWKAITERLLQKLLGMNQLEYATLVGDLVSAQDTVDGASDTPRSWGRWLLLAQAARFTAMGGRVTPATAQVRSHLLEKFAQWWQAEGVSEMPYEMLARKDPIQFSLHVEEYRRVLYEQGETRRNFAETVNVMNQRHPFLKNFMAGPWGLLTTWELLNPGKVHPPVPAPLLKAMVTTALAWQWMRFALMILLGYFGMLRPCEMLGLRVEDCILAVDSGCEQVVFLRLELVKTRTRGARRQSVRLEEPCAVQFLQKCLKVMAPGEKLWPYSANLFRVRLRQVLQASTGQSDLCVPSSLRAGGATYYFRLWNEDLLRLQWRGGGEAAVEDKKAATLDSIKACRHA